VVAQVGSAFWKDAWRTIVHEKKRFVCILLICVLGTTMVCGLRAACFDLRNSASQFYSGQGMYDVCVQSTLGLTSADVDALAALDSVDSAEGAYEETTYTQLGTKRASVGVKALSEQGFNQPYLLDGRLPQAANEVAVSENYLTDSGLGIGATVALEASENEVFKRCEYTIVGTVIDPTELTNPNGSIAVRASASPDYQFFTTRSAVTSKTFTAVYAKAANPQNFAAYSDEYNALVSNVKSQIEGIKSEREQARSQQIRNDAYAEIDEQEESANRELISAEAELESAQEKLDQGASQLATSKQQMQSGAEQLASGREQLEQQRAQLEAAQQQVDAAYANIASGQEQIASGREQVTAARTQTNNECDQAIAQLDAALAAGAITQEEYDDQAKAIEAKRSEALVALQQKEIELEQSATKLETNKAQLDAQAAQLASGKEQLEAGKAQLDASEQELASGKSQIAAAESELASSQAQLNSGRAEYESSKAEAKEQLASARANMDALEDARWYVQDRESNAGYASVGSDASSIEAIGYVFPVVFLVVAVLIALTTITRLVEEERGLIGTYKSLGYSNRAILCKYVVYALLACVIGTVLGLGAGFVLFPSFLFSVFQVMYLLPNYLIGFDPLYGIGSLVFFVLGIVGAAVLACRQELRLTPAALMRPKAPPSGSRIFLERIGFIWNRLSFLNKVTARNLLRYKKRFFMTIFGIMGCMALLICGFAIKDSVHALSPMQYGEVYRYSVQAVVNSNDFDEAQAYLQSRSEVSQMQAMSVDTVTVTANGSNESMQLYVLPDGADLSPFVALKNGKEEFALEDSGADSAAASSNVNATGIGSDEGANATNGTTEANTGSPTGNSSSNVSNNSPTNENTSSASGMILTRNAAELLGVADGGTAHLKTNKLDEADVPVVHVVDNYLGNAAYLSQSAYQQLFGKEASLNGFYVNLAEGTDGSAFADELGARSEFLTVTSTQQMNDEFAQSFALINTIVYVIVGLAAALAFVVLFTLSSTNISERIRELATIKVLGFRKREVSHYVNKETVLLTGIGMLLGIPAGYAFSHSLTYVLKMPSIYFAVTIEPISYAYACALTLLFAIIVAAISNRTLQKIDMIEALKSVE
jgi:putative ABC transport system permease protein